MNGLTLEASIDALLAQIDEQVEALQIEIDMELEASCLSIVARAKVLAAKNYGRLANEITYKKLAPFEYELIGGVNYFAYMEFGTKSETVVPAGFEDIAAQYKGVSADSGGMTLEQAIKVWAKRKGIHESDVFWIYLKIKRKGVKPHPALIPAYLEEQPKLEARLKQLLA